MSSLAYKTFFRKQSTSTAILAVTLLVAVVSSMYAIVNFINMQTTALGQLRNVGNQYLVLNKSAKALSDSHLNVVSVDVLKNGDYAKSICPQKLVEGTLYTNSQQRTVFVHGIENLSAYLKAKPSYVNGSVAAYPSEANMGVLLAKACNVNLQEYVKVSAGGVMLNLKVVGIVRSQGQLDNELIVCLETANTLAGHRDASFIEFSFKDGVNRQGALDDLSASLPSDVAVVKVQQTATFLQHSNSEILSFLSAWSWTVYLVVAAASHAVATRLTVESEYELVTLKALGIKSRRVFALIFSYTVMLALAGTFFGLALGLVGTQVASTVLGWFWQGVVIAPFLEPIQVGQILVFSVVSSAFGCVYPAFRGAMRSL
jgi:ABC-type lipoprotein release transport system permease subunit